MSKTVNTDLPTCKVGRYNMLYREYASEPINRANTFHEKDVEFVQAPHAVIFQERKF